MQTDELLAACERYFAAGEHAALEACCREILAGDPTDPRGWAWLGIVGLVRGAFTDAESAFRRAIELCPEDSQNWSHLGAALLGQTRHGDAEQAFQRAVELRPGSAAHWSNLGAALASQAKWPATADALRRALALDASQLDLWPQLAVAEHRAGRLPEAEQAYDRSFALGRGDLHLAMSYARLLHERGQREQAKQVLEAVQQQAPNQMEIWTELGKVWHVLDDWPRAQRAFERAVALGPADRPARHALAKALLLHRFVSPARRVVEGLLAEDSQDADAWTTRGHVELALGRQEAAVAAMQRAASLSGAERHYTALLQTLHYVDRMSPEELLAGHRQWNNRYAAAPSARPLPLPIEAPKNRRLRLGFLSCDFAATPIGYLALPALQHLDRTACSVICYHDRSATDGLTRQFMAASDAFVSVAGASDDACTTRIRQDEIDILVDLTGHYGNRLGVFARRAAPVQMTWLGYVGTTGLATMDCLLADWVHVAAGEEPWYSEQVLRMPHGYACYGPPAHVPDVGPLPAAAAEWFTFGCLNGAFKYSPRVLDLWAEILRRVGHADLLLAPFWAEDAEAEAALRGEFASRGIDPARVRIESCRPHLELLALYGRIDLALDTQPYSGGLTTCEALWMGVPVITFPGQRFAGRHATSHMINAGYPQFVAHDEGGYVELAAQWANRREELAAIRGQMRGQVRRSPLCDGPRFAEDFLGLLSGEWQRRGASRLQWL